ncbi:argininosuccinate lyase [Paraburkholderia sp. 5N]|uniref:argininosuccinate lyase n=1 Tax=Paraburkholderia elongata TaxID=2675747 RepID=A0A972NLE5_9BURK|nr:argininosuccinate lyase [Paraburkholderia elongata]
MTFTGKGNPPRRFEGPSSDAPAQELIDTGFAWEIADAPYLHHGLNVADLGHVLDLHHRGIIPDAAARALLGVLVDAYRVDAADFPYDARYGEPYNSRERHFAARIGDAAGWLHAGRPRREAARVALRIVLRRLTAELLQSAAAFAEATATVAARHREVFMADQTYLQQAQPSTFGHYLLAFVPPVLRDGKRLLDALGEINQSPGGAGCVNGSRLLGDRTHFANLLGFDGVIDHTRDAMWQTDGFVDVLATSASVLLNQSKLAEDLEIWSSQEFDYVDLAGPYTRASVLMPQKRNPYSLSIVRGSCGVLIGRLTGFLAVVKSPSARSDNLIFAYGEIPRALELSAKISNLMRGVVSTLTVNDARMWQVLEGGFSQATDLAEHIMLATGIDYRTSYRVVGEAVKSASRKGLRGIDIDSRAIDEAAQLVGIPALSLNPDDLARALDPRAIVATRTASGGAAPDVVAAMAERDVALASQMVSHAEGQLARFTQVESDLLSRVEWFLAGGRR